MIGKQFQEHRRVTLIGVALAVLSGVPCIGEAPAGETQSAAPLRIGYTLAYEDALKRKNVRVAVSYLMTKALASDGVEVDFSYFDTYAGGLDAVLGGAVDAAEIPGHYLAGLSNGERGQLRGILVPQRHETHTSEFMLLAPEGKTLEDLKGGRLRIVSRRNRGIAVFWLDSMIAEKFEGQRLTTHFGEIVECEKPSDAMLPTFFGKAEACVVAAGDVDILAELNPQVVKRLHVVERSEALMPMVLAMRKDYEGIDVEKAVKSASTLHEDPDGQQALTLMQVFRFSRYDEAAFAKTRALVERATEVGVRAR